MTVIEHEGPAKTFDEFLRSLRIGDPETHENMTILIKNGGRL